MTSTQIYQTGLLWFTHDLRIDDNQTLLRASETSIELLCVFIVDPAWFKPNRYGLTSMGQAKWRFLFESLKDLKSSLEKLHQSLLVIYGAPEKSIAKLIENYEVGVVYRSEQSGLYENRHWQTLQKIHTGVVFREYPTHTLFSQVSMPVDSNQFQTGISFTQFRNRVEPIQIDDAYMTPICLPPTPKRLKWSLPQLPKFQVESNSTTLQGGASQSKKHLLHYFSTVYPSDYKNNRDALDGWENSTKLSPWLAHGCLSVRQVMRTLKLYERTVKANESTYWISFELLWREYFQWYARANLGRLFMKGGLKRRNPLTSFYPERFKKWCHGNTPYPLVNACMNQLNQTGFMSNRGRQIVASCLVNELSVDWRYGAAYFEQQLVDYDVAVNWGNWQYLAGVGSDPRGKRHFDLAKQTSIYDPDGEFIRKWKGETRQENIDSVDIADWPILPHGQ